ncbi:MAG: hypothetical protein S4CHLAM2_09890 [Chlamydiales bacterium]|nr:hypothetical protein [Chlamydiales bacterium]
MKRFIVILLLLSFCSIQAETEFSPPPAIKYRNESLAFNPTVPKVNVITGEYCEKECDLVVAGAQPLSIRRFYNHQGFKDQLMGHWRINPESLMLFNFYRKNPHPEFAGIGDEEGQFTSCEAFENYVFRFSPEKNKNFTSLPSPQSGRKHPLNMSFTYTKVKPGKHQYYWSGHIQDGSGRRRTYRTEIGIWKYPINFAPVYQGRVQEDRLPNGNVIKYHYQDIADRKWKGPRYKNLISYYLLIKIEAFSASGTPLGHITLDYDRPNHDLFMHAGGFYLGNAHFTGTDGREVIYHQKMRTIQHWNPRTGDDEYVDVVLNQAKAPWKPAQSYRYRQEEDVELHYETPYLTDVCRYDGHALLQTLYDLQSKKVIAQNAPVGPGGAMHPIARYSYHSTHTSVFDGENNQTIFRFDPHKRIIAIEKYDRNDLALAERNQWEAWTGNLLQHTVEDGTGKIVLKHTYRYDAHQNVIEERVGRGSDEDVIYRTYTDDGFNLVKHVSDREGKTTAYTYLPDTDLPESELVYDQGVLVKRTFHFYDSSLNSVCIKTIVDDGNSLDSRDLSGVTTRKITEITPKRDFPCIGLPEEVCEKSLDCLGQEMLLKKTRYAYHPSGKVLREEHFDATGAHCYTLHKEYDQHERCCAEVDALGKRTTFVYDANFNLCTQKGPLSQTTWVYDKANRPIQKNASGLISRNAYDLASRLQMTIDPCGNETRYQYDGLGRIITVTYGDGSVIRKAYDALGNVTKEVDQNGHETRKTYDFRGKPTSILHPDGSEEHYTYYPNSGAVESYTDRSGTKTVHTYDIFDHLILQEIYSPEGELLKTTSATYSPFHKLSETSATGVTTYFDYDYAGRKVAERTLDRQILYTYDALGRLKSTQNGETLSIQEYDVLGRVIEKRTEDLQGNIYFQENYAYDANGNKTHVITCAGVSETLYNARNQPVQITSPDGHITTIAYDYAKQFTKTTTNPNGVTTIEVHHPIHNHLTHLTVKNASGQIIQRREHVYDPVGNRIETKEHLFEGTVPTCALTNTWEYGPCKQLLRLVEAGTKETRYFYGLDGRLETTIKPDKAELRRTYDALGRLHTLSSSTGDIAFTYFYDLNDHIVEVKSLEGSTRREYDLYGNCIAEHLANGLTHLNVYNPEGERIQSHDAHYSYRGGRLAQIDYQGKSYIYQERNLAGKALRISTPKGELRFRYDPCLRIDALLSPSYSSRAYQYDPCGNLLSYNFTDSLGTSVETYVYDPLNQLIEEKTHCYAYDSLYNRIVKDSFEHTLNALSQTLSDGETAYDYDHNGNLIRAGEVHFAYDTLDRLVQVKVDGTTYTYTYDPFNRRISKESRGKKVHYHWDDQHEVGSTEGERRVLGEGMGIAAFMILDKQLYVPVHDHRGNVVTLLGGKGATYRYTAFGEESTEGRLSPWRFSSKRIDPETGYVYFGRRYYSPPLGKWVSPDPQGFEDGPNLYAYVHNAPLTHFDPYGLWMENVGRCFCLGLEWVGANLLPVPGLMDLVESVGRWGSGGDFWGPSRYRTPENQILTIPGHVIPGESLTFGNGMLTTCGEALQQTQQISDTYGGAQVDLLYNGTNGLMMDLLCCFGAKLGMTTAYNQMCANYYINKLNEDPEHRFTSTVHSRGGIRLMATGRLMTPEQRSHIDVISYGSGTLIPNDYFGSAVNNLSCMDPIPMTNPLAYGISLMSDRFNVNFLTPTSYCPLKEHGLLGSTYLKQIKQDGEEWIQDHFYE